MGGVRGGVGGGKKEAYNSTFTFWNNFSKAPQGSFDLLFCLSLRLTLYITMKSASKN